MVIEGIAIPKNVSHAERRRIEHLVAKGKPGALMEIRNIAASALGRNGHGKKRRKTSRTPVTSRI